jgi:trk system potassium uptake protein TrkA
MNIVILGAGELGRQLAWTLGDRQNKVVVIDTSGSHLERLRERIDVMTIQGDCADVAILKSAGIAKANLLIAVTGSDASNILACQVAKYYQVKRTICRLSSAHFFSEEDGYPASTAGIDDIIFPEEECVSRIMAVLEHQSLVEKLGFVHSDAKMCAFRITAKSPLVNTKLCDFADKELLKKVRFCLLIREQKLIVPSGNTVFYSSDEVYVSGANSETNVLLDMADPSNRPFSLVVVAGATRVGHKLITGLLESGKTVRVIEKDLDTARRVMDQLGKRVMVIHGDATEKDVLEDAGLDKCDAYISTLSDDEDNILSCVLAKKCGARKVICVTNKAEYMDIVPAMSAIDCGFSPRLVAVNTVLNLLGSTTARVHALLHRTHAYVYEFEVQKGASVCGKTIAESIPPGKGVLALVLRGETVLPATGETTLQAADKIAMIMEPHDVPRIEQLFRNRRFF